MLAADKIQDMLANFMGSETFVRHWMSRSVVMTEGVMWLAENAEAMWLTDLIVSLQTDPKVKKQDFQQWKLTVDLTNRSAVIVADNGNGREIARQDIPFTTFPLKEMTIWLEGDASQRVMMLPRER